MKARHLWSLVLLVFAAAEEAAPASCSSRTEKTDCAEGEFCFNEERCEPYVVEGELCGFGARVCHPALTCHFPMRGVFGTCQSWRATTLMGRGQDRDVAVESRQNCVATDCHQCVNQGCNWQKEANGGQCVAVCTNGNCAFPGQSMQCDVNTFNVGYQPSYNVGYQPYNMGYQPYNMGYNVGAYQPYNMGYQPYYNMGYQPYNMGYQPYNMGYQPYNMGYQPYNMGYQPYNMGYQPYNMGYQPYNMGYNVGAYQPYNMGYQPYNMGYNVGAYQPYNMGYQPYNMGYQPYNMGYQPYNMGYQPYNMGYNAGVYYNTQPYNMGYYATYNVGYQPYMAYNMGYQSYNAYNTGAYGYNNGMYNYNYYG